MIADVLTRWKSVGMRDVAWLLWKTEPHPQLTEQIRLRGNPSSVSRTVVLSAMKKRDAQRGHITTSAAAPPKQQECTRWRIQLDAARS